MTAASGVARVIVRLLLLQVGGVQLNEGFLQLLIIITVTRSWLYHIKCRTVISRALILVIAASVILNCSRLNFDRLQNRLVRPPPLQFAECLVQDARQGKRAIWLLQVTLVPIVEDAAYVAVF